MKLNEQEQRLHDLQSIRTELRNIRYYTKSDMIVTLCTSLLSVVQAAEKAYLTEGP